MTKWRDGSDSFSSSCQVAEVAIGDSDQAGRARVPGNGELPYERSESTRTGRRALGLGDPPAKKPYGEGADEQIGRAG